MVYQDVLASSSYSLWERMQRYVRGSHHYLRIDAHLYYRTLEIGPLAGIIYLVILCVDCIFFQALEWAFPSDTLDYVVDGEHSRYNDDGLEE